MLTRTAMLATQKRRSRLKKFWGTGLVLVFSLTGCGPPGPRALLQGERLIRDGKYAPAVEKLKLATELLPKNAQAWNHLGLAYHGAGQASNAVIAYGKALSLNRDLIAAHYNLGSLWLEQNNPTAAIEELTSFVAHPQYARNLEGWLKLGTAHLRARRWDDAEKTYQHLLKKLEVRTPEVFNNLGVVHAQRRRPAEAIPCFNSALRLQPDYGPALLNLATVYQQQPGSRPLAVQKYRQYLALKPPPPNAEAVEALVRQFDPGSHPAAGRPVQSSLAVAPVKTNVPPPSTTHAPVRPAPSVPPVPSVVRTSIVAVAPPPKPVPPAPPPTTTATPPPRIVTVETAKPAEKTTSKPAEVEVAKVPEDLVIKPAQDVPPTPPVETPRAPAMETARGPTPLPDQSATSPATPAKRNLIQRLNPFGNKTKTQDDSAPDASKSVSKPPPRILVAETAAQPPAAPEARAAPPPPAVPRHVYLSPAKPADGNRGEAERYFLAGAKAQRAGMAAEAVRQYQRAVALDPSYFDAYYNLGLAAAAAGNVKLALMADEYALAIKPDSADARYNFALALKQAGYLLDAANELQTMLNAPSEAARAHLSLANLYAHQLDQPDLAREHYQKVLASNPQHPQAAQIRYWLANHP